MATILAKEARKLLKWTSNSSLGPDGPKSFIGLLVDLPGQPMLVFIVRCSHRVVSIAITLDFHCRTGLSQPLLRVQMCCLMRSTTSLCYSYIVILNTSSNMYTSQIFFCIRNAVVLSIRVSFDAEHICKVWY